MDFLNSALQANGVRLTEAQGPYNLGHNDPDYKDHRDQGFRRLTQTQNERDLMPLEQQRQTEIALFLYDSNPLAKRIIDLVNSFVTGDGFTFSAKHPAVLKVLSRFWEDPVNDWPLKQLDRFRMLSLCGEVLWPVAVRKTDGRVHLGYVDPANIEEIIPDPYNPEISRTAIIRLGYKVDGATELPTRYSLVNVDDRPNSIMYDKLNYYPEPHGAFYFAINKPPNATRGRSDLITAFDWLDLYDQLLFGSAERATYLTDFVWDVQIKGADEDALKKWYRENPMPKGAAMRVHNENVEWKAVSPNLGSFDIEMMARIIKQHILTRRRIVPHSVVTDQDVHGGFSADTQILTDRGWLAYDEVTERDRLATIHPDSGVLEYQHPTARYEAQYHGPMVRISGRHAEILVTPHHPMWTKVIPDPRRKPREAPVFSWCPAGELDWRCREFLTGATDAGKELLSLAEEGLPELPMDLFLEFLGFQLSDGSNYFHKKRGEYQTTIRQNKLHVAAIIRRCLGQLPFHHWEWGPSKKGTISWTISKKALYHWLVEHTGRGSEGRRVPSLLFSLSPRQIDIFLSAFQAGDGTTRKNRAYPHFLLITTSRQLADDLQRLAVHAGYTSYLRVTDLPAPRKRRYTIEFRPGPTRAFDGRSISRITYAGAVFGFSVPNRLVMTRRHGKVAVTGDGAGVSR